MKDKHHPSNGLFMMTQNEKNESAGGVSNPQGSRPRKSFSPVRALNENIVKKRKQTNYP